MATTTTTTTKRPRPDRTTKEGMIWNAEDILDRLESYRILPPPSLETQEQERQRRRGHVRSKSGGEASVSSTIGGTVSSTAGRGLEQEENVDVASLPINKQEEEEEAGTLLPIPLPDHVQGILLLSVVVPPIANYVGRVGTGLAYRRVQWQQVHDDDDDDDDDDELLAAAHKNEWSLPKLVSLTNLALPLLKKASEDTDDNDKNLLPRQKAVLDLVMFVCEIKANKENQSDDNKDTNSQLISSWWDRLSHPAGLVVAQERVLSFTKTEKDGNNNDADDDNDNDGDDTPPSQRGLAVQPTAAYTVSNLAAGHPEMKVFPFSPGDGGGDCKSSSIYYYAWHKEELLLAKDNQVHLERVVLMEMVPTPDNASECTALIAETPSTTTSDESVRSRLEYLLKRSSWDVTTDAPVDHVRIPPDSDKEQGSTPNELATNDKPLVLDDQPVEESSNTAAPDLESVDEVEVAPNGTTGTTTDGIRAGSPPQAMDEIVVEDAFVSEDYC